MNEDHDVRHSRNSHIRQKVWQVLRCLVSTKQFEDRLAAAAGPLFELNIMYRPLLDKLPEDVRRKFDDVIKVLTKHQSGPECDGEVAELVRSITDCQRSKIAEKILDLYVAVSGGL